MDKVYIVELRFYDESIILGVHSSLDGAKSEIDRINSGEHIVCKNSFYNEEWDRTILVRKLNTDHDDNFIDEISYKGK